MPSLCCSLRNFGEDVGSELRIVPVQNLDDDVDFERRDEIEEIVVRVGIGDHRDH